MQICLTAPRLLVWCARGERPDRWRESFRELASWKQPLGCCGGHGGAAAGRVAGATASPVAGQRHDAAQVLGAAGRSRGDPAGAVVAADASGRLNAAGARPATRAHRPPPVTAFRPVSCQMKRTTVCAKRHVSESRASRMHIMKRRHALPCPAHVLSPTNTSGVRSLHQP